MTWNKWGGKPAAYLLPFHGGDWGFGEWESLDSFKLGVNWYCGIIIELNILELNKITVVHVNNLKNFVINVLIFLFMPGKIFLNNWCSIWYYGKMLYLTNNTTILPHPADYSLKSSFLLLTYLKSYKWRFLLETNVYV